jgi:hypothetical protein
MNALGAPGAKALRCSFSSGRARARRSPGHVARSITEWSEAAGNVAAGGPTAADLISLIPLPIQSSLQQHISTESVSHIISNIQEAMNGEIATSQGRSPCSRAGAFCKRDARSAAPPQATPLLERSQIWVWTPPPPLCVAWPAECSPALPR